MTDTAEKPKGTFDFSVMAVLPDSQIADLPPDEETEEYRLEMREQKRNELIARVRIRELTREKAEALARKARVGPLASRLPDMTELSADMTFWSIEMTAVWTIIPNAKAVHRHHGPSYRGILVWGKMPEIARPRFAPKPKASEARYDLVTLEKARFGVGYVDFDGEIRQLPRLEIFFTKLQTYLSTGEITAVGQPAQTSTDSPEISPGYWETADFDVTEEDGACLSIGGTVIYRNIVFKASELLKFYPPSVASRLRPARVHPWKENIEAPKLERYKIRIVDRLKTLFPRGLPDWGLQKIRDWQLLEALGPRLTERWWKEPEEPGGDKTFNDNAFRVAMDRLLSEVLEDDIEVVRNLY